MTTVITNNQTLRKSYESLKQGDTIVGRISLRQSEEHLLVDLVSRGVHLIPSALSQLASRSKVFQAKIFKQWLPPKTYAVHDNHQLLDVMGEFSQSERVITKLDRKNAGMGIHLWATTEDVFTHATLGNLPYPFVLQPFHENTRDIRVVIIGEYIEAYWRENSDNFRNNLHCGGKSLPCDLKDEQISLCRKVMDRGQFPYAHIDLMVVGSSTYVLEINLRGGLKGAKLTGKEYLAKVEEVHQASMKKR